MDHNVTPTFENQIQKLMVRLKPFVSLKVRTVILGVLDNKILYFSIELYDGKSIPVS